MPMNVNVIPADSLTPEQMLAWSRLQRADVALASPFFRPEFVCAASAIRQNVEVAVLEEGNEPVGFFPFARTRRNVGQPVASPMNDFQGPILAPGVTFNARQLIRQCGLVAWHFDHLAPWQSPFWRYRSVEVDSPYVDLSGGFDAYQEARSKAGSRELTTVGRKTRKLGREHGPLRFEFHTADRGALEKLIEWKKDQCRRTKVASLFDHAWSIRLLEHVLARPSKAFSGVLSALYVDDRPAAVHLGIRSQRVLHWWFPAYDPTFRKYSPGMILLAEVAKACQSQGIKRIDLGKGMTQFKNSFMSGAVPVAEGSVDSRPLVGTLTHGWLRTRDWVRSSRLRAPAHRLNRFLDKTRSCLGLV